VRHRKIKLRVLLYCTSPTAAVVVAAAAAATTTTDIHSPLRRRCACTKPRDSPVCTQSSE
jgi:hypothetical protein